MLHDEDHGPDIISRKLHYHIIGQGRTRRTPTVEAIADELGVQPVTVYKWLESEHNISLWNFVRLVRYCNSRHLLPVLREVVRLCRLNLAVIPLPDNIKINGMLEDDLEGIMVDLGAAVRRNIEARPDGYDAAELEDLTVLAESIISRTNGLMVELNAKKAKL